LCRASRSPESSEEPLGGTASDDDDSDSGSEPWYDDVVHGAEDVGKSIVHGGAESVAAMREAADKSLELASEARQRLEMAAQFAGRGLEDAGNWAWAYRGTLASLAALAGCLIPAVDAGCAAYLAAAYVFRADQRIQDYGFSRSLEANEADLLMTGAFAIPMAGGVSAGLEEGAAGGGLKALVNTVALIPDAVQIIGGFLPGHDSVFFNGNTLGP
jgi:hypothetical protein